MTEQEQDDNMGENRKEEVPETPRDGEKTPDGTTAEGTGLMAPAEENGQENQQGKKKKRQKPGTPAPPARPELTQEMDVEEYDKQRRLLELEDNITFLQGQVAAAQREASSKRLILKNLGGQGDEWRTRQDLVKKLIQEAGVDLQWRLIKDQRYPGKIMKVELADRQETLQAVIAIRGILKTRAQNGGQKSFVQCDAEECVRKIEALADNVHWHVRWICTNNQVRKVEFTRASPMSWVITVDSKVAVVIMAGTNMQVIMNNDWQFPTHKSALASINYLREQWEAEWISPGHGEEGDSRREFPLRIYWFTKKEAKLPISLKQWEKIAEITSGQKGKGKGNQPKGQGKSNGGKDKGKDKGKGKGYKGDPWAQAVTGMAAGSGGQPALTAAAQLALPAAPAAAATAQAAPALAPGFGAAPSQANGANFAPSGAELAAFLQWQEWQRSQANLAAMPQGPVGYTPAVPGIPWAGAAVPPAAAPQALPPAPSATQS